MSSGIINSDGRQRRKPTPTSAFEFNTSTTQELLLKALDKLLKKRIARTAKDFRVRILTFTGELSSGEHNSIPAEIQETENPQLLIRIVANSDENIDQDHEITETSVEDKKQQILMLIKGIMSDFEVSVSLKNLNGLTKEAMSSVRKLAPEAA